MRPARPSSDERNDNVSTVTVVLEVSIPPSHINKVLLQFHFYFLNTVIDAKGIA